LKLKCDDPLSNVAFNFNLRRYHKVLLLCGAPGIGKTTLAHVVGRCRLNRSNPH
jgi:SpoVK/Ycf46/Vps4 family AAA+-type ATPase